MAATTNNNKSTKITKSAVANSAKMMLYCTVIIACFTSQFLSVNALRCHQCNSHTDEDCTNLRLSTPRAPRDNQFLKECNGEHEAQAFCRKTLLKIDVTGENRITRECGWIKDKIQVGNNTCFTADNEGYKQVICACTEEGCNGSQTLSPLSKWSVFAVTAVSVSLATVFRRN